MATEARTGWKKYTNELRLTTATSVRTVMPMTPITRMGGTGW